MNIFIDTADVEQIIEYRRLGLIHGVTTNPEICAMCAISDNPLDLMRKVVAAMEDGYVFVQVVSRSGPAVGGGEVPRRPGAQDRGQGPHG